jgi:uncharacterized protein YcnI
MYLEFNLRRFIFILFAFTLIISFSVNIAHAHVVVRPGQVKTAQYQDFTMSVPVEKDQPTTQVRLVIPEGLEKVRPNVKPGWTIELKRENNAADGRVLEILWKDGNIPVSLRDEFIFSAKTPGSETSMQWKAYQTYQDGSEVSWDQKPKEEDDKEESDKGPYSETKVANTPDSTSASISGGQSGKNDAKADFSENWPSYLALLLSLLALGFGIRSYRKS